MLYTNQILQVKWKSITGDGFSVLNCVKQGGVLYPVLFAVYIDDLLKRLSKSGMGCKFMGAVSFADYIKLLTPMCKGLKTTVNICEKYAEECVIKFNGNTNNIIIINYCIIYAKHFIYEKKINNDNNIDFLSYLSLLKRQLLIEREICIAQSQEHKFIKFNPVLENL